MKDYPAFLKLYNETFPADERRLFKNAEHVANFVRMKGGKFAGFVYDDGGDDFLPSLHTGNSRIMSTSNISPLIRPIARKT